MTPIRCGSGAYDGIIYRLSWSLRYDRCMASVYELITPTWVGVIEFGTSSGSVAQKEREHTFPNLIKSRSHEMNITNLWMALKSDRRLCGSVTESPLNCQALSKLPVNDRQHVISQLRVSASFGKMISPCSCVTYSNSLSNTGNMI